MSLCHLGCPRDGQPGCPHRFRPRSLEPPGVPWCMPLFLRALRAPGCPVSPHGWGFPPSLQVQRGVSPGEQERAGGTASGPGDSLREGWGVLLLYLLGSGRVRPAERWRFWKRHGAGGGSCNPGSMRPPPAPRQDLDPALDDDTCQGNGQTSHRPGAGVRERHIRHRTVTQIIRTTLKTRPENKQPDCKKMDYGPSQTPNPRQTDGK